MKRVKKLYLVVIFSIIMSIFLVHMVQAVTAQQAAEPGTDGDPLVTKGYVDMKSSGLQKSLDQINAQSKFQTVELNVGKQLLTGAGTEIILRSGTAKGIKGTNGGLSDITSGKDIVSGGAIVTNHLLISSRDDGRGIKISTKAWILVRGSYKIK